MKINAENYPYPFLSDANDNYIDSEFSAETVGVKLNEDTDCFEIEVAINLKNGLLEEMLEDGDVSLIVHAECPSTYFNEMFEVSGEDTVVAIEKHKVAGKIELSALLIANNDIANYTNEDLHPDFQDIGFNLISGNLLGGTSAGEITIDNEIPKKVEAIFKIKSSPKFEPGEFDADYTTNKILIYLSEKDHYNFQRLLSIEQISSLLYSLVVIPVLIDALYYIGNLSELGYDTEEIEQLDWYKSIKEKLSELDIYIDEGDEITNPIQIANNLIENPLDDALTTLLENGEADE